jgi:hypothetical protein
MSQALTDYDALRDMSVRDLLHLIMKHDTELEFFLKGIKNITEYDIPKRGVDKKKQ